jgi:SAM-dependent methyltransferase
MDDRQLTEHAQRNRRAWDRESDAYQATPRQQLRDSGGIAWGLWQIPEAELRVIGEVAGRDVVELGCGACQWAIALAQRGARMTGLDVSTRQLQHAREAMDAAGVDFPLVCASAEALRDAREPRPPGNAVSSYKTEQDRDWARRWPMEQIWRVRRVG